MKRIFLFLFNNVMNKIPNNTNDDCKKVKRNFFTKLIDDDNDFSTINFFLVAMTIIGIFLLLVPMAGLIVDICYNHTITINL